MSLKNKRFITVLILVMLLGGFFIFAKSIVLENKYKVVNNPIGRRLLLNWHSLKKIVNIVHFPYWFKETELEKYGLIIMPKEMEEMNSNLPINEEKLILGSLLEGSKHYVDSYFAYKDYSSSVKIRYRGINSNNWDAEKKAFRIKFPKENLFQGMKSLNLFIPKDRGYFTEPLDAYRAKKLGLVTSDYKFVKLEINRRDFGVYLASEPWSKEFLAKRGIFDENNIFSNKDIVFPEGVSLFSERGLPVWKSYTADNENGPFEEINTLVQLITKADNDEFTEKIGELMDLEKFFRWQVINTLAGSVHQDDRSNSVLLFRKETGKFEYLPWDVNFYELEEGFYETNHNTLAKRILEQKVFFKRYNFILNEYLSNQDNLIDDLAYYDNLYSQLKKEFYDDQAKLENDFEFSKTVKNLRTTIINNFEKAKKLVSINDFQNEDLEKKDYSSGRPEFIGSFIYFNDIFRTKKEFLASHLQFRDYGANFINLSNGSHIFTKTVIIPKDLELIIDPGAKLFFLPEVSFISYSPVQAMGTASDQITFLPAFPGDSEAWGTFGVVNVEDKKNNFYNIRVSGGSSANINGIAFTSQFSLHNSQSVIRNSNFENSHSDDALHVILGSVDIRNSIFVNNQADALDLDYVKDSEVKNNFFNNVRNSEVGGDAIDLSGVRTTNIEDNKIANFSDKCISVGENSEATLKNNIIGRCNIGIAVKDSSKIYIFTNTIVNNKESGVALYRKKPEFIEGGHADILSSIIWNNGNEINSDSFSYLDIASSTVKGGYDDGESIDLGLPDFKKIIPINFYNILFQNL